jgi:hypothetical protein
MSSIRAVMIFVLALGPNQMSAAQEHVLNRGSFLSLCANDTTLSAYLKKMPELKAAVNEIQGIVSYQRQDYADQWLADQGIQPEQCPKWRKLFEPLEIELKINATDQSYRISWAPSPSSEGTGDTVPLCFKELRIVRLNSDDKPQAVAIGHIFCLGGTSAPEQSFTFGDFNFDGREDVRVSAPLEMSQSRKFDLILLQDSRAGFQVSQALSSLDDLEVDPKKKTISSRWIDGPDNASSRKLWRLEKGTLKPYSGH